MDQLVRTFLTSSSSLTLSLHRLLASASKKESPPTVNVLNDPPEIFVSDRPAILLQTDGQPVLADIPNTKLRFVVNTSWPLLFDKEHSNYYLFTDKQWLTTNSLEGPWSQNSKLPDDMSKLKKDAHWSGFANAAVPGPPAAGIPVPTVFYSTSPAEVILFQGSAVYSPISGTQLVRASNTDSDLFVYTPTQQFYYLVAGGGSAASLEGTMELCHARSAVGFLAHSSSSPASQFWFRYRELRKPGCSFDCPDSTTVIINPATAAAKVVVQCTGPPDFKPIKGTSMEFAANTADKVIKVNNAYFLCQQGIWFTSPNPLGPWTTAREVPQEIYTIPPSSPLYNVTYVTQTTTSDGNVKASHTAGYFGAFVVGATVGAIIANGSGYYYPPYFYYPALGYPFYRPYIATYGVGSFYNCYTGSYGVARGVYGPYGAAGGWAHYNPYTGNYSRGVSAYGPYGSATAARSYNPYTGLTRGATLRRQEAGVQRRHNPYTGVGAAGEGSSPIVSGAAQWLVAATRRYRPGT